MRTLFTCFGFMVILLCLTGSEAQTPPRPRPEKVTFGIRYGEELSRYSVNGIFVLPSETLRLRVVDSDSTADVPYVFTAGSGTITPLGGRRWQWKAPAEHGLTPITIRNSATGDSMLLNVFVMIPFESLRGEYLNGYRIGTYPTVPLRQLPIYQPPRGFVEVTPENESVWVSPHFQLKQFLSKQEGGYPKYLVLRERLLLKLELILEEVNRQGIACRSFTIMSGFRTPYYNHSIGNVPYSRHVYGGAADIFIDENPVDGLMDDLNGDGLIDRRDAAVIYEIIEGLRSKSLYSPFPGGLGSYRKTEAHGPFVHVDVRGFPARW